MKIDKDIESAIKNKDALIEIRDNIENWTRKCYRFLAFCINGGLTDFTLTLESLIELINRTQNVGLVNEINEFIFNSINLKDIDYKSTEQHPKVYIPSINERTNFSFNEDILCICIKTGWLSKYLSESVKQFPIFMKLLLKKFCTNKLLTALFSFLKYINEQTGEEGANADERNALSSLITPLAEIYGDSRRNPTTLVLAAKCLCAFIVKDNDKKHKIIMIQEDIVPKISSHLENYDYDDKLVIISLELLTYILTELKSKINEYLTDVTGVNLITNFKNILKSSKVPGTYFSQRVLAKVLTTILSMTNILEAGIKERFNSPVDVNIYDILINILDENKKWTVINPQEENSYIVEYKAFYLLFILLNKNEKAKEYLFSKLNIKDFIEKKAESYKKALDLVMEGIKNKDGFTDNKVNTITESIKRYFEFCYNLIVNDYEKIRLFQKSFTKFNTLLLLINNKRSEIGLTREFDVYNWINRLYRDNLEKETFN